MTTLDPKALKLRDRLYETRRRRVRQLISRFETLSAFCAAVDESPNYFGRVIQSHKKGRKNLGESKARAIETRLGLPLLWLDQEEGKADAAAVTAEWPFSAKFPRAAWDDLPAHQKRLAESMLLTFIQGLEAQRDNLEKDKSA